MSLRTHHIAFVALFAICAVGAGLTTAHAQRHGDDLADRIQKYHRVAAGMLTQVVRDDRGVPNEIETSGCRKAASQFVT